MTKTNKNGIEFARKYLGIIAENVRALRGQMSQDIFASKVGVSRLTVSRIENRKNFHIVSLFKIAEHYHMHPGDLCMPRFKGQEDMLREMIRDEMGRQKSNKA